MRGLKLKHTAIVESCFQSFINSDSVGAWTIFFQWSMNNFQVFSLEFVKFLRQWVICNVKLANDDCCAWLFFRNSLDKSAIAIYNKNLRVSRENHVNLAYHQDIVIKASPSINPNAAEKVWLVHVKPTLCRGGGYRRFCLVRAIIHEDVVITSGKVLGQVRFPKEILDMVVLVHCNCSRDMFIL